MTDFLENGFSIERLWGRLPKGLKDWQESDRKCLEQAFSYLENVAGANNFLSEERRFVDHLLGICQVLVEVKAEPDTLIAAVLSAVHSVGLVEVSQLKRRFKPALVKMVVEGERVAAFREYRKRMQADPDADTEILRRMLLAMVQDPRVVLVKLASRVAWMRLLKDQSREMQIAYSEETRDLYAPLANRLGVAQLKWELEDLSFRFLDPDTYKHIAKLLAEKRTDREAFIATVKQQLGEALAGAGIVAKVAGRPKHIFSIWKKMQRKGGDFADLSDVRAVRLLVDDIAACYAALGIVHSLWQPIPHEFDDYIANPKANLYQSLHTAVIGPEGKTVEVQIRSHDMHEHAERGVAAHWRYKEGGGQDAGLDRKVNWLRRMLSDEDEAQDENAVVEQIRGEAFDDRVYVFTPQGRVVDLRKDATPLDFAYAIHTDVGHRCRGAKVDGRIVPLTHALNTGQQVEILTAKEGGPSRDWMDERQGYLRSSSARSKVKAWFNKQDASRHALEGRAMVDREMKRLDLSGVDIQLLADRYKQKGPEELYVVVGRGDVSQAQIAAALQDLVLPHAEEVEPEPRRVPVRKPSGGGSDAIRIQGVGNLLTTFAKCCQPVPPDPIVGFITRGRGVTIHRWDCANVAAMPDEERARLIEVDWGEESSEREKAYLVDVAIQAADRQGLLRDVTAVLSNERVNVIGIQTETDRDEHLANMRLSLEVRDTVQLSRILDKLHQVPNVLEAKRRRV